ncbi:hypothetical protein CR969_02055 [Candidatus Saccharibacteria bacterium]|nr:MAG: hypothetical protein CR969_02055 [Candidatus Saccharibacteria bacterium]
MRKFSAVLLILVLSCLLAYPVLADDNVYSDHDLRYFRDYDELSCAPTTVGKPAAKDNLPKIYNYFIAKGVSKEIAAAIVGNISQESNEGDPLYKQGGGRTDKPASVGLYADGTRFENKPGQKSGIGKAWGLSQWDPGNAVIYWAEQSGMKGSVH